MDAGELIKQLSKFPPTTRVVVWEGYNAGCVSDEFVLTVDTDQDGATFIRLED